MCKRSLAGSAIVSVFVCRGWRLLRERAVQSSMVDRYRAFVGGCRKEREGVDWLRVCVTGTRLAGVRDIALNLVGRSQTGVSEMQHV
jgi:hypothetical protein